MTITPDANQTASQTIVLAHLKHPPIPAGQVDLNLISDMNDFIDLEIDVLRISPQSKNTPQVIEIYDNCMHGKVSSEEAEELLKPYILSGECNGYWHGEAGMDSIDINEQRGCI